MCEVYNLAWPFIFCLLQVQKVKGLAHSATMSQHRVQIEPGFLIPIAGFFPLHQDSLPSK